MPKNANDISRSHQDPDLKIKYRGRPYRRIDGATEKKLRIGMLYVDKDDMLVPILNDEDEGRIMVAGATYYVPIRQNFETGWDEMEYMQMGYSTRLVSRATAERLRTLKNKAQSWGMTTHWRPCFLKVDGGNVRHLGPNLTTSLFEWTVTHGYRAARVAAVNSPGYKRWFVMWRLPGMHNSEQMKVLWYARYRRFQKHQIRMRRQGFKWGLAFAEAKWNDETRTMRKKREKKERG